jgi:DNA-binding MarR family transcriptional regulator
MAEQGLDPTRMAAWRAFLEAHRRTTARLARELQDDEDLPLTWFDVLVQLSEAPSGSLRMQDLADRVLLSQSGLTRLVDRMETAGLVERRRCPEDGRGTLATVTRAGLGRLRRAWPTHLAGVREAFADVLTEEEAEVLARALRRVAAASQPSGAPCGADDPA